MKKYLKGIGFYLLLFLVILMVFFMTRVTPKQDKDVYSELVRDIQNHEVSEISIADDVATVKMKNSDSIIKVEVPGYETLRSDVGDEMEKQIKDGSLKVETPLPSSIPWWVTWLPTLGMVLLFAVFWFMFMQQSGSGGRGMMNFGKSTWRQWTIYVKVSIYVVMRKKIQNKSTKKNLSVCLLKCWIL